MPRWVSMHRCLGFCASVSGIVHRRLVFCYASLFDCSGLISRLIVQMGELVGYYSICSFLGLYINSTAFMGWRAGAAVERTAFKIWELPGF